MSKHTTRDVLRMAGHLLADPKRHAVGYFAKDAEGRHCASADNRACQWCLMGAITAASSKLRVQGSLYPQTARALRVDAARMTLFEIWDKATTEDRLAIAAKLRSA